MVMLTACRISIPIAATGEPEEYVPTELHAEPSPRAPQKPERNGGAQRCLTYAQPSPSPTSRPLQIKTVARSSSTRSHLSPTSVANVNAGAVRPSVRPSFPAYPTKQLGLHSTSHRDNHIRIRILNRNHHLRPTRHPAMAPGPNSAPEPFLLH